MPETQQHALGEIDIAEATSYGFYRCCYLWCCEIFFFSGIGKKIDVLRRCASETADLLQSKKDDTFWDL